MMPAQAPTSFASAAAGGMNQDGSARSIRADSAGPLDWPRPRTNGTGTATFRRPSVAAVASQSNNLPPAIPASSHVPGPGAYVPPHHFQNSPARNGVMTDSRFSKQQLLGMYKAQKDAGELGRNTADLFMAGWQAGGVGAGGAPSWTQKEDAGRDSAPGPDLCWDFDGRISPLGLVEMSEEEKMLFVVSVNSPLKPPTQATNKEQNPLGTIVTRKTSFSQNQGSSNAFGLPSPTSVRPTGRRREASDSVPPLPAVSSPFGGGRTFKEGSNTPTPPPLLLRRRTDMKDAPLSSTPTDRDKDVGLRDPPLDASPSFPGFLRRTAPGSAGLASDNPSSPWSKLGSSFSPMGAFASFGLGDGSAPLPSAIGETKTPSGTPRNTSRWSKLMSRDNADDPAPTEKPSMGSLARLNETGAGMSSPSWGEARGNRAVNSTMEPSGEPEGSAVNPPADGSQRAGRGYQPQGTRRMMSGLANHGEDFGFADMIDPSAFATLAAPGHANGGQNHPGRPRHLPGDGEPLSPTETNPYQSPVPEKAEPEDIDTDGSDIQHMHHAGLKSISHDLSIGIGHRGTGARPRSSYADGFVDERSQSTSTGANRGFPSLGGIGGFGNVGGSVAWPPGAGSAGRLELENPLPSHVGNAGPSELSDYPPSRGSLAAGLAGSGRGGGPAATRGSMFESLFPPAMQAQLHGLDASSQSVDSRPSDAHDMPPLKTLADEVSRGGIDRFGAGQGFSGRETDSPFRNVRGYFEDGPPSGVDDSRNRSSTDYALSAAEPIAAPFSSSLTSDQAPSMTGASNASLPNVPGSIRSTGHTNHTASQPATTAPGQASQPPPSQQRTMVMPDRMRWIYRDTQGSLQGPFSGLEMHDWFKAGFFSAELLVKKYEDPEFEPLGQLIRRIGNSREPFLVPQIGIPHGPPSSQANPPWNAGGSNGPTSAQATTAVGSVQPPFAGAFPSFGTTLTAEQQNALERRKQEEQFLMARQKEYLAQQQVLQKQMHHLQGVGVHPQGLHHHSSAHSLHSQPSFGSITSPSAFHPTPPQGPSQPAPAVPSLMEMQLRPSAGYVGPMGPGSEYLVSAMGTPRDDELVAFLARQSLSSQDGASHPLGFGAGIFNPPGQEMAGHSQHVAAMLAQRAQLQSEQGRHDSILSSGTTLAPAPNERLQQFHELRARVDGDFAPRMEHAVARPIAPPSGPDDLARRPAQMAPPLSQVNYDPLKQKLETQTPRQPLVAPAGHVESEGLSLTQQVQQAASAQESPAHMPRLDSVWAPMEKAGLPQPFPPPPAPSISPLPAPAAQRNRHHLPDALTIEQESRSPASSVETTSAIPSLAPWAKEASDGPKGPSLREIQKSEARKAAKAEEAAAAARRAQLAEQDRLEQQQATLALTTGLPSSATWGSGSSPGTPTGGASSAWAKPLAGKVPSSAPDGAGKKTLSQIQKEEEARKLKAAAAAAAAAAASASSAAATTTTTGAGAASGKRYADFAGKAVGGQAATVVGAWTTVGASGRVKLASTLAAAATAPPGLRVASGVSTMGSGVGAKNKAAATTAATTMPAMTNRSANIGGPSPAQANAQEEFTRWAKNALSKGLHSNINVDDFVQQLLMFPPEAEIISESVYANSQTMDGRRFAEEFLRRRKLVDKAAIDGGVTPTSHFVFVASSEAKSAGGAGGSGSGSGGGWSEVAKKGAPAKEAEGHSMFKVVSTKKGRKK
ncbi:MAG: hypothetical protein M1826_004634 [Phylliscum demangeonii]|nr:MAG: hypothetical protein M1826_004634 [Phylliscum demangeonii]